MSFSSSRPDVFAIAAAGQKPKPPAKESDWGRVPNTPGNPPDRAGGETSVSLRSAAREAGSVTTQSSVGTALVAGKLEAPLRADAARQMPTGRNKRGAGLFTNAGTAIMGGGGRDEARRSRVLSESERKVFERKVDSLYKGVRSNARKISVQETVEQEFEGFGSMRAQARRSTAAASMSSLMSSNRSSRARGPSAFAGLND